ncbi:Uncharacterized protein APZ42_024183 [Daphnia magna]|uniref:Uncharacterized protein n=1 Tax=Daphnia magna TaxID=35525 RepID=A0A0P5UMD1_9CRUS|nr:Uncharacterized protein APZ42_024183 [Daphnia magna]
MLKITLTCSISVVFAIFAITCGLVGADCCYKVTKCCCRDGTAGTPYWGVERCNILGCNCECGCRQGTVVATSSLNNVNGPNTKFQTFLDNISTENSMGWELSYFWCRGVHCRIPNFIMQEGF